MLFEHLWGTAGSGESFIREKAGHLNTTLRNLRVPLGTFGDSFDLRNSTDGNCPGGDNNEVTHSVGQVVWNWGGSQGDSTGSWWSYRNTLSRVAALTPDGAVLPGHEMDVIAEDDVNANVSGIDAGTCDDAAAFGDNLFDAALTWDADQQLTGVCRANFVTDPNVGVFGHEMFVPTSR